VSFTGNRTTKLARDVTDGRRHVGGIFFAPRGTFYIYLRHQDLEGIHLPSFRFYWKLKNLCRADFFVFGSWQTAVKSQGKTIIRLRQSAMIQKQKKSTRQSFFRFQENLNEGK
jgi:hypothetical protein